MIILFTIFASEDGKQLLSRLYVEIFWLPLEILGLKVNSILARRISAYLIYGDSHSLFV